MQNENNMELTNSNQQATPPGDAGQQEEAPKKGGRPSGKPKYANCQLNIYLSEDEFRLFHEFVAEGWYDKNASGAGRFLLMRSLHEWVKKGRKKF
jgi:hypothetical protein